MRLRDISLTTLSMLPFLIMTGCGDSDGDREHFGELQPTATPTSVTDQVTRDVPRRVLQDDPDAGEAESDAAGSEADIPEFEIEGGNREVYVADLTSEREQRLTDSPAMNASPAWSPDGEQIAWVQIDGDGEREAGLYVANADGSDVQLVTTPARPLGVDWHPDGDRIAFVSSHETDSGWDEVHTVNVDGSDRQQVTFWEEIPTEQQYYGSTYPVWSPDGDQLAVVVDQLDEFAQIHVLDFTSDEPAIQLTDIPDQQKGSPTWSPDGTQIAFHATPHETPYPQIFLASIESGEAERLDIEEDVVFLEPDWSPDGERIALSVAADVGPQIEIMRPDGSDRQTITSDPSGNSSPSWAPDGSRILFIAERDDQLAEPGSRHADAVLGPQPSLEALAWSSHHVLIGTVVEEHPPAWAAPLNQPMDTCLTIWSDYTVEIEQQFRGEPAETVRVRLPGGAIGDHEQTFEPSLDMNEGDRLLMFLTQDDQREPLLTAYTTGIQRAWTIVDSQLESDAPANEFAGLALTDAEQTIREALSADPPAPEPRGFVPLEQVPIGE